MSGQLHVVQAEPEGIVTARDRNLLIENGGHIHVDIALTRGWAISILKRMGYVKQKAEKQQPKQVFLVIVMFKPENKSFCLKFQVWLLNTKSQTN